MAGVEKFVVHSGTVIPLDMANVDTDQIIPKQFLKSIKRTGFGENLFDAWRFKDEGYIGKVERQENHDFVLNDARYRDGTILLARRNFGCGSSREHAVWAILQYGIRCIIAPSFADIFFSNSLNNGLLLITLDESVMEQLFQHASSEQSLILTVDLEQQRISSESSINLPFQIEPMRRKRLLEGLDEISLTFQHQPQIQAFEQVHKQRMPWLFTD